MLSKIKKEVLLAMERLRIRKVSENEWALLQPLNSDEGLGNRCIGPAGEVLTTVRIGGRSDEWSLEKGSKGNYYLLDYDSMLLTRVSEDAAEQLLARRDLKGYGSQ
jgi:hypothetical protein